MTLGRFSFPPDDALHPGWWPCARKGLGGLQEPRAPRGTCLTLHCCPQEERPPQPRYKKGGSVGGVCYLSMGMVVLLMGLVFASVYIYRYFFLAQVRLQAGGQAPWSRLRGRLLRGVGRSLERCCL